MTAPQGGSNHIKKLNNGDILFREGDSPDSMYVVKRGRLIVFKQKGNSEIELATVNVGQMVGEMAFFDRKPRSASARADLDTEVIELPFKSLQAQFDTFPEWIKAIVKTINEHLRDANKRIKSLEQVDDKGGSPKALNPHQASKLCSILSFVGQRYGTADAVDGGLEIPSGTLRKFTIQVFQEPTAKMQILIGCLQSLGIVKFQELGEGRVKINLLKPDVLQGFVEWFNEYLYTSEEKRVTLVEDDMKALRALVFYSERNVADAKGISKINLTAVQNESMKDLGFLVTAADFNKLITKGICSEKIQEKDGLSVSVESQSVEKLFLFWQIAHSIS